MINTKKLYNIVTPSWAMASGVHAKLEPADDNAPSAYVVRVWADWDNCRLGYIDIHDKATSWAVCELIQSSGRVILKTCKTWHGQEPCWSGDSIGTDRHPEVKTLCDRAKDALERYLDGKSAAWWSKIRSSVLRSPGLCADLPVRLPRRKHCIVLATIELITPND